MENLMTKNNVGSKSFDNISGTHYGFVLEIIYRETIFKSCNMNNFPQRN